MPRNNAKRWLAVIAKLRTPLGAYNRGLWLWPVGNIGGLLQRPAPSGGARATADESAMSNSTGRDRLKVTVHRAAGLRAADRHGWKGGASDPFVEVFFAGFEDRDEAVGETAVRKATIEPSWEQTLELLVPTRAQKGEGTPLVLHVLDHDHVGRNDFLGEAQIPARLWRRGCERVEVSLKKQEVSGTTSRSQADEQASGAIVVSCEWTDGRATGGLENIEAGSAPTGGVLPEGNAAGMGQPRLEGDATPSLPTSGRQRPSPGAAPAAAPPFALPPLGPCEIFVRVFEGRDFASTDKLSLTGDSLVKVSFNDQTRHTSTASDTNNPYWDDRMSFSFELESQV